ncbi:MAG: hypothetical protein Q9216_005438 [Gyalolechia sp. 2 TL-2023]
MNEAIRRGAWTCLGCSGIARRPQALTAKHPNPNSKHQRKHSSSKASSSSKNESRPPTAASEPASSESPNDPPVAEQSSDRSSSRAVSKPSAAEAQLDAYPNIPSVPSTQYLHPAHVHLASLFSRHRPISITTPLPSAVSDAAFSSIFEPKQSSKFQPAYVIQTVSSAIDSLENVAFQDQFMTSEAPHRRSKRTRRAYPRAINRLDDSTDVEPLSFDIEELSNSFRHMVPPPPPVPMNDEPLPKPKNSSRRRNLSSAVGERTYSTTLTITERTLPNGQTTYQASLSPIRSVSSRPKLTRPSTSSSSPSSILSQTSTTLNPNELTMIEITPPSSSAPPPSSPSSPSRQPFLDRMKGRQQVWEYGLTGKKREIWRSISVKRQRKLKMKKHKYKKLMRKTRNLRRRLDRN